MELKDGLGVIPEGVCLVESPEVIVFRRKRIAALLQSLTVIGNFAPVAKFGVAGIQTSQKTMRKCFGKKCLVCRIGVRSVLASKFKVVDNLAIDIKDRRGFRIIERIDFFHILSRD